MYKVKCMIGNNKNGKYQLYVFVLERYPVFRKVHCISVSFQFKKNLFSVSISTELKFTKLIMFMMMPKSSPI